MTMQRTPLLLSRLMERGPLLTPDEEIVTRTDGGVHRQSYADLRRRSHQLAHALAAHGIAVGDRVGSFLWNNHRHLELDYAVPSMGAVLHTLNIRLGAADLAYIANHAGDRVIFIDDDLLPKLEEIAERLPAVERYVICSQTGAWKTSLKGAIDYEEFLAGKPEKYAWPELDENAPMGLCYTSGTTGNPKGVMYTHRSTYLHTMASAMTDSLELSAKDSTCAIVPMFHAMSWGLPFTATMLGTKQVLPHRFMDAKSLLDLFVSEKVTISAGVPTIWQAVRAAYEAEPSRWDLGELSRLTCGGSAPPVSLMRWYWDSLGVEMIQGWGMTETNPLGTISRRVAKRSQLELSLDQQFANAAKAGLAIPGIDIEIVDDKWQPLPHDGEAVGELLIRGPWIASEYYKDPQPDKFHDGWLVTGDVARIDRDQYLIIADRSKDLIKSGGEWISSVDLENTIVALPGVAQAAVVAQPHPKWDERPVALVVTAKGAELTQQQVIEHLGRHFANWQLPDEVLFVDALPLTSTGKLDKKVLRADLKDRGYLLPDLRGPKAKS
ncbi:MAG: long-chain fatty acid--CoA ligase [Deltaproteobacteria bacterium]|nr:long-chain fatty acid--CoA ligase [Deltaproteobacteria bacterium]